MEIVCPLIVIWVVCGKWSSLASWGSRTAQCASRMETFYFLCLLSYKDNQRTLEKKTKSMWSLRMWMQVHTYMICCTNVKLHSSRHVSYLDPAVSQQTDVQHKEFPCRQPAVHCILDLIMCIMYLDADWINLDVNTHRNYPAMTSADQQGLGTWTKWLLNCFLLCFWKGKRF